MVNFGKARKITRGTSFRKPTRGGGRRGSKYDAVIEAICELEIGQYLDITVEDGQDINKVRAFWAQMLSSRVRPALTTREGVGSRVELSKDFEATYLEDTTDCIAIVCKPNEYTQDQLDRDRERTAKAQATRSNGGKATESFEDDDIDF